MSIAIIVWDKDLAGMNVKNNLLKHFGFSKNKGLFDGNETYIKDGVVIYTISTSHINRDDLDKEIDADIFIFATVHRSESGKKSLSVHAPGNWGSAGYGGADYKLCVAPAKLIACLLRNLEKNKIVDYDIVQECTHHGPYMEKPCLFIEIGSNESEWKDEKAGYAVAKSIIDGLEDFKNDSSVVAFGIGGPHYCPNFKKLIIEHDYALGHVCPKYALHELDESMVLQAIKKTFPKCDRVILDWKGLGAEKERIIGILRKNNIDWKKLDEIRN